MLGDYFFKYSSVLLYAYYSSLQAPTAALSYYSKTT